MYDDPDVKKMTLYGGTTVRKSDKKKRDVYEDFFSYEGGYMPARVYYREKARGKAHAQIWMDYGRKYSDDFSRQDETIKAGRMKITSLRELAEYILASDLLTLDQVKEVREKEKGCDTVAEYIALFPEIYQPILRMRYLYDRNKLLYAEKEMESLEKTLARDYDADRFTESAEDEK